MWQRCRIGCAQILIMSGVVTALAAGRARSAVITETFSGDYNHSNFALTDGDPDSTFGVTAGQLVLQGGAPVSGTSTWGGFFTTTFTAPGDFEATVDLTQFDYQFEGPGKHVVAGMWLYYEDGNDYARLRRLRGQTGNVDDIEFNIVGGTAGSFNTSVTSGSMKIARTGSQVSGYLDGNLVWSGTAPMVPVYVGLGSYRVLGASAYTVGFDNFTITAVPEPAGLSFGVAGISLLVPRRRQKA